MQYAGIRARCHDGAVGGGLRAVAAKFVQQLRVQMVFTHVLPRAHHAGRQLHRAHMGAGADARRAPHGVLFAGILDQPHLVGQLLQVALVVGHKAPNRTRARRLPNHPATCTSSPGWMPNGYQTTSRPSIRRGSCASSSVTGNAASTPAAAAHRPGRSGNRPRPRAPCPWAGRTACSCRRR